MNFRKEHDEIVGQIYDTCLNPEGWRGILERLCERLDAVAGSIHTLNPVENRYKLFVDFGTKPEFTASLHSEYAAMSPVGAAILLADVDQTVSSFDFIDEDEFMQSRFYREWMKPQNYYDMLGSIITKRPSEIGALGFTGTLERGRFDPADREWLTLLVPHVRRAVTISGLLEQNTIERNAFAGVIDHLSAMVLLVDREGRLIKANPAAERAAAKGDLFTVVQNRVSLVPGNANDLMSAGLLARASEPLLIPLTTRDNQPYLAALMLVNPEQQTFALMINSREHEMPALGKHLAGLFGLTPREVCVLMPLLSGATLEDIAGTLGISVATARTHLNSLFAKTGTNRQSSLVQTVMGALPPVQLQPGAGNGQHPAQDKG